MKPDRFKLSLLIFALVSALADAAYVVFLGIQIYRIRAGMGALHPIFQPVSIAVIVLNAALLCYTIVYLVFRKR
ncbi:MAG: hypothetical protein PHI19_06075 [Clostridia bacterium]|nr:hypothetical protein [Clostridia bacterium]